MAVDRQDYFDNPIMTCPFTECCHRWCRDCGKEMEGGSELHHCKNKKLDRLMRRKGWRYCPGEFKLVCTVLNTDFTLPFTRLPHTNPKRSRMQSYDGNSPVDVMEYVTESERNLYSVRCSWLSRVRAYWPIFHFIRRLIGNRSISHFCYKCGDKIFDLSLSRSSGLSAAITAHYSRCRQYPLLSTHTLARLRCSIQ